jgi:predicted nucleotidyltransferase
VAAIEPVLLRAISAAPSLTRRRIHGVWLFGSEGRQEGGPDSDVDVGILCEPPLGPDRPVVMDELASALSREVDVVDLALASPTLAWEVVTSGKLIREEDDLAIERFLRTTRYDAEDAEQRNRMIVLAQTGRLGDRTR